MIQLNTLHVCLIIYMISTGFNYVAALQVKTEIFRLSVAPQHN